MGTTFQAVIIIKLPSKKINKMKTKSILITAIALILTSSCLQEEVSPAPVSTIPDQVQTPDPTVRLTYNHNQKSVTATYNGPVTTPIIFTWYANNYPYPGSLLYSHPAGTEKIVEWQINSFLLELKPPLFVRCLVVSAKYGVITSQTIRMDY
jgi:hypothetical protein